MRIRNHIIWARSGHPTNAAMPANSTNISYDNNLFGRDGSSSQTGGTSTTGFTTFASNLINTSGLASDIFANTTAPATTSTYLHLKSTSPAVNAANLWHPGTPRNDLDGRRRPLGTNPDMGAFADFGVPGSPRSARRGTRSTALKQRFRLHSTGVRFFGRPFFASIRNPLPGSCNAWPSRVVAPPHRLGA